MRKSKSYLRSLILFSVLLFAVIVFSNKNVSANTHFAIAEPVQLQEIALSGRFTNSLIERDVFDLINQQRVKHKLGNLIWNDKLSKMARAYSKQMAKENFFSHFDSEGRSIVERADDFEIDDWKKIGENLFFSEGYVSPSRIAVNGWRKSPSHWKNILDKEWTHTGVGAYETRNGKTYITQVFVKR